jgi:hypothetical protein
MPSTGRYNGTSESERGFPATSGKTNVAMLIALVLTLDEGWLAGHMLIMGRRRPRATRPTLPPLPQRRCQDHLRHAQFHLTSTVPASRLRQVASLTGRIRRQELPVTVPRP